MKKHKIKKITAICVCICVTVFAVIIAADFLSAAGEYKGSTTLMNTVVSVDIRGKDAKQVGADVVSQIGKLENASLSRFSAASSVSKINAGAGTFCQADSLVISLIGRCEELFEKSGGAFSPLLGGVSDLWGFGTQTAAVPADDKLNMALTAAKDGKTEVVSNTVKIPGGTVLDFGAVGKGVACDEARDVLKKSDVKRAVISVGGSILLYGEGQSFSVGVRNPLGSSNDCIGTLSLGETCVSTSGSYERKFTQNGKTYHHILNPETGYPVDNDLLSVTVVCDDGFLSDALSTACFVLGYEKSLSLLEEYGAQALFVFENKNIRMTDGLVESFELSKADFTILNGDV